jgi:hypothetical protein
MKRILIPALTILFILLMCSCGAQAPSGSAPAPSSAAQTSSAPSAAASPQAAGNLIEPSQLISQADAEQITGAPFDRTERSENKVVGLKLTQYIADDNYLQIGLTQQAFIETKGVTVQSLYEETKAAFPGAAKAAGVGDDAYFVTFGIHILYKGYYFSLCTSLNNNEVDKDRLVQLGKLACANLDKLLK